MKLGKNRFCHTVSSKHLNKLKSVQFTQNKGFKQQITRFKTLVVKQENSRDEQQANIRKFNEQLEERKRLHAELLKSLDKYGSGRQQQTIKDEQQNLERSMQQVKNKIDSSQQIEGRSDNGVATQKERPSVNYEQEQIKRQIKFNLEKSQQQNQEEVDILQEKEKNYVKKQQQQNQQQKQQSTQQPSENRPKQPKTNVLNAIFVSAECAPWSKTGGLGDVAGALPLHLAQRGHRVMVVSPRFENYDDAWETGTRVKFMCFGSEQEIGFFHCFKDGVDYIFIDHPCFHNRIGGNIYTGSRLEILFRFAMLSKSAIEAAWHAPCGGTTYGEDNLVFVANDWHTALVPIYLQAHYRDHGKMFYARCVFVIHNIAHQGRGPFNELGYLEIPDIHKQAFYLDDPVGGVHMNIMKAAFLYAHRIVAVSPGYAWECQTQEGGWGLDGILREQSWKLLGIVNGISYEDWSPNNDVYLKNDGYTTYDIDTFVEGKRQCKEALQRELGLPVNRDIPMLGFIGRLDYQKGVDLIIESFDWLMSQQVQLVLLGSGREDLENALRSMEGWRQDQCRGWVGFSNQTAHRITAGCDLQLMPSRFEPCGLNQLYAMNYGTIPVVHAVGGLRDTVKAFDPFQNSGTGWTFTSCDGSNFRSAVHNALVTYRQHRDSFHALQERAMSGDYSWDKAAKEYERTMIEAKFQW